MRTHPRRVQDHDPLLEGHQEASSEPPSQKINELGVSTAYKEAKVG
jgi:hypothetical protein